MTTQRPMIELFRRKKDYGAEFVRGLARSSMAATTAHAT